MARLPRWSLPGHLHLLLLQGLAHQPVVVDDDDRRVALDVLREAASLHGVSVHAYALRDDRLRLLATPGTEPALGLWVQDFGRRYVARFNRRHGRRGTLWDGRYRATVVQSGAAALQAMLFVDGESRRSETIDASPAYRWSSAEHHLGHRRDPLVRPSAEYWQLGNTPFERERAYALRLAEGLTEVESRRLDRSCRSGWPVGDAGYLERLSALTDRPVRPRPRGRPPNPRA